MGQLEQKSMKQELKTGWLSPTGEFYEAGLYEHNEIARELSEKLRLPCYDFRKNRRISADDQLLRSGWAFIGIGVFFEHEWRVGWGELPLTPEQKRFLKPYFEESDIPMNEIARERWELEI